MHIDVLFQAYFNACLILMTAPSDDPTFGGIGCPFNPGNPYLGNPTQVGFSTFGPPAVKGLMCEVATRALKATWHKKWQVHRRLRPEAWGGLVHNQKTHNRYAGVIEARRSTRRCSTGCREVRLLPAADGLRGGGPMHPSYGPGMPVAGACVTILKAMFDERFVIPNPVVPAPDGLSRSPTAGRR